jgi:carboxylesterase type B
MKATGGFYTFSNVRYAAPPTGDLRFRAPQKPSSNRCVVQTGNVGRICPQSLPQWIFEGLSFTATTAQVFHSMPLPGRTLESR